MATLLHRIEVYSDGSIRKTSPQSKFLMRVKSDQFTVHWGGQVRNTAPAPAVFRTGDIEDNSNMQRAKFTEAWQWFHVDLLALAKYGMPFKQLSAISQNDIVRAFKGMTTSNAAFNNRAGTDQFNCYPSKETDRPGDPLQDPLICAKDVKEVLAVKINGHGTQMALLRSFDQDETPPAPDLSDPRVGWATVINEDGTIHNFPQLGGTPVPYVYLSASPCWYPLEEMETP